MTVGDGWLILSSKANALTELGNEEEATACYDGVRTYMRGSTELFIITYPSSMPT